MVFTITNPHLLLAVYDEIFSLCSSSTRKPLYFGLRVAKRIEKTDIGFLDTPFVSLRATRKPLYLGLRVAKRIEKTDIKISASFMMLCLISIVVYGNAD